MHERGLAHHARRRSNAAAEAHADLVQLFVYGLKRFGFGFFAGLSFAGQRLQDLCKRRVANNPGDRMLIREIANRVFTTGAVRDIAARELVGIDVADQRPQRLEVLVAGARLIVIFDKGYGQRFSSKRKAVIIESESHQRKREFARKAGSGNITAMAALEDITRDALKLSRRQRLALAGFLLEMDDPGSDGEVEAAWEQEILARIQAIDDGTATGVSYDEVMRAAQDRLTQ